MAMTTTEGVAEELSRLLTQPQMLDLATLLARRYLINVSKEESADV